MSQNSHNSSHSNHTPHEKSHVSGWFIVGVDLLIVGGLMTLLAFAQILRVAQTENASSLLALIYVVIAATCLGLGAFWAGEHLIKAPDITRK